MARQSYRKKKRKVFRRFLTKFCLVFVLFFAMVMGATIFFKVETIMVEGNNHYSEEEIIEATNIQLGSNLFSIKQDEISKKITYVLPYVQSVEIKLHLPTGIRLVVEEQKGMVQLNTEDGIWYMGVQGKLLEFIPAFGVSPPVAESLSATTSQEENFEIEGLGAGNQWGSVLEEGSSFDMGGKSITFLSWQEEEQQDLVFDPETEDYVSVSGIVPLAPVAGEQIQVDDGQKKQLASLLDLFQEMEEKNLFQEVSNITFHPYLYLEFYYGDRFWVKFPLGGDYDYKFRALLAAVADLESYETGVMDLTQTDYVVLFTPD